jgi:hypothetical protein
MVNERLIWVGVASGLERAERTLEDELERELDISEECSARSIPGYNHGARGVY